MLIYLPSFCYVLCGGLKFCGGVKSLLTKAADSYVT